MLPSASSSSAIHHKHDRTVTWQILNLRAYDNSRAAYLGYFAENDEFEPQSKIDQLEQSLRHAGRLVTFYRYTGTTHWFFEPDRPQAFNQAAASLAWERTLAFLKRSPTS